jgi:hypothetical protein
MVRKILVSLSGILADAQDRGLVAQNVVRNRQFGDQGGVRMKRLQLWRLQSCASV